MTADNTVPDMFTTAGKLADLKLRYHEAVTASGEAAIQKQHAKGKKTARERIDGLLDHGSFVELDEFVRHRTHAFGMDKSRPYGDAVVTGTGTIHGRQVAVYSQDFTIFGGSLGEVAGDKIIKVIAGEDDAVTETMAQVYGAITSAGVFRAASIRAAEAAKVIENAQRDINVAFMNEVTQIMAKIGVSAWDVLDAARTKWNFLGFEPGLVGGHCIGVDPFYLSHLAQSLGHHPQVILAGRETNDAMGDWIADRLHAHRGGKAGKVLLMGLTFKENVPDLRNSRSIDLYRRLTALGHEVAIADPEVGEDEVRATYGIGPSDPQAAQYDLVVGAVRHDSYRALSGEALAAMLAPGGTLADIKGMWRDNALATSLDYWTL